jgi:hypothetical protein
MLRTALGKARVLAHKFLSSGGVRFVFIEYDSILPIASAVRRCPGIAAMLEPLKFKLVASYPVYMTQKPQFA